MLQLLIHVRIHRTLEKFRETEAEHRHKKDAAVLQLEEKQTLLQLELREANRKVKEGKEQIEQLEAQLVTIAQMQQRQDEESAEELKKEIHSLQEQLDKERKKKNKQSEANQSLKQVSSTSSEACKNSILPSIQKACSPNKPSVWTFL